MTEGAYLIPDKLRGDKKPASITDDGTEISVPGSDFDGWIEKGMYIFCVIGSTFLVKWLSGLQNGDSIVALLTLFIATILVFEVSGAIKKVLDYYASYSSRITRDFMVRLMGFTETLVAFVATSYSILLIGSWFYGGRLNFGEILVAIWMIVCLVLIFVSLWQEYKTIATKAAAKKQR
jgi:hypothetical protein